MNDPANRLRVVAYLRVSTEEQAASGAGLAAQETTLRENASRNGWDIVATVRDEGVSAKDLDRAGLREALRLASTGGADAIAVAKLDRLTGSLVGLADLMEWTKRNRLALIAVDLGLDTSTGHGRLVAPIIAPVGEWQRERNSERTRLASAERRRAGLRMGRAGVRDALPAVAGRIAGARAAGQSWQAIADGLNADGVPTVRCGARWRVSSVQSAAGYGRPPGEAKRVALPDAPRRRASPVR
jgi:DNA invertase Pin-like site-specific DNA recombinase